MLECLPKDVLCTISCIQFMNGNKEKHRNQLRSLKEEVYFHNFYSCVLLMLVYYLSNGFRHTWSLLGDNIS